MKDNITEKVIKEDVLMSRKSLIIKLKLQLKL